MEFHVLKEQSSCHDLNKPVSLSDHCLLHITFVPCLLMQSVHSAGHEPFPSLMAEIDVVSGLRNHYFPPVKWQWEVSRADRGNVYLFIDRNQMEDFPSGKDGEDLAVGPCLVGWLRSLNSFKSYRLHASNQNLLACQTFICQIYNNIVYSSTCWQCEWCMHGSSNVTTTIFPKLLTLSMSYSTIL